MVYVEAVIQGFSLKWLFYIYLGNSRGGVHFQWSCRSAVLVGVGSFVGVSQLFYLPIVWTTVFGGIALSDCFIILYTLFIFNLHGRKALWRAPRGWIFDKYLVLYQVFIKHQVCVGDLQSFPCLMTNLLTQCFY